MADKGFTLNPDGTYTGPDGATWIMEPNGSYARISSVPSEWQWLVTSQVVFASHDDGTMTTLPSDVATIKITTRTSDANLTIDNTETLTQAADGQDPTAVLVSVITTTDANVIITTNSSRGSTDISINTVGAETTDDQGRLMTTMTTTVTRPGSTQEVFAGSTTSNPTELTEPSYRYLIMRHDLLDGYLHGSPGGDYNMTCNDMYSLFNIACVQISEGLYQTLKPYWVKEKIIEIDGETAYYGTTFFSEIRPTAKVWEAKSVWYGEKTPVQITPEIQGYIVRVMKAFAYEIVFYEMERRYYSLRDASDLEAASWQIQREEAEAWLADPSAETPFLDYLVGERHQTKEVLVQAIQENVKKYHRDLAQLLIQEQNIIDRFNACDTVWDLNTLYEDLFGITMPVKQAIALGRTVSDTNWNRLPQYRVKGNGYYF